jgi:hypothetical protein
MGPKRGFSIANISVISNGALLCWPRTNASASFRGLEWRPGVIRMQVDGSRRSMKMRLAAGTPRARPHSGISNS